MDFSIFKNKYRISGNLEVLTALHIGSGVEENGMDAPFITVDNKSENKKFSFKNILNKVSETLKINYKIDENELSKISKISDDISDKSLSIIKNIQDTIKNFNNFDIS